MSDLYEKHIETDTETDSLTSVYKPVALSNWVRFNRMQTRLLILHLNSLKFIVKEKLLQNHGI